MKFHNRLRRYGSLTLALLLLISALAACTPFYLFLACSHGIAAVCRGAGYSKVPMYIMLGAWCVLRVTYITIVTNLFHNISLVFAAYPMTWAVSTACFLWYYNKSHWLERVEAKYL